MFEVTFFYHASAQQKTAHEFDLETLADRIESHEASSKDQLEWLKLAHFGELRSAKNSLRWDQNVQWVTGAEADIDDGALSFEEAADRLSKAGIACIIYTSPSHTPERHRYRVVAPFSERQQPDVRKQMVARLNGVLDGHVADESFTLSQSYYYGRNKKNPHDFKVLRIEGDFVNLLVELDQHAKGKTTHHKKGNGAAWDEAPDLTEHIRRFITGEVGHPAVSAIAGFQAGFGAPIFSCKALVRGLYDTAISNGVDRYIGRWQEFEEVIDDIYRKEDFKQQQQQKTNGGTPPPSSGSLYSAEELGGREFMAIVFVVQNLIPEGTTLFAGKPKIGKSWLALAIASALAHGEDVLGVGCEESVVFYYALEDGPRRMNSRMTTILGERPKTRNLWFNHDLPTLDKGGISVIRSHIKEHPNVRLIIVDTLAAFRGMKQKNEDAFQHDYRTIKSLADLGRETNIPFIVVHHTRKLQSDDIFDMISGTYGLAAAADTLLMLTKLKDETIIAVRGRDVEPCEKTVSFNSDNGQWEITGDYAGGAGSASEDNVQSSRNIILGVLAAAVKSLKVEEICERAHLRPNLVRLALRRMLNAGQIRKTSFGTYTSAENPRP